MFRATSTLVAKFSDLIGQICLFAGGKWILQIHQAKLCGRCEQWVRKIFLKGKTFAQIFTCPVYKVWGSSGDHGPHLVWTSPPAWYKLLEKMKELFLREGAMTIISWWPHVSRRQNYWKQAAKQAKPKQLNTVLNSTHLLPPPRSSSIIITQRLNVTEHKTESVSSCDHVFFKGVGGVRFFSIRFGSMWLWTQQGWKLKAYF